MFSLIFSSIFVVFAFLIGYLSTNFSKLKELLIFVNVNIVITVLYLGGNYYNLNSEVELSYYKSLNSFEKGIKGRITFLHEKKKKFITTNRSDNYYNYYSGVEREYVGDFRISYPLYKDSLTEVNDYLVEIKKDGIISLYELYILRYVANDLAKDDNKKLELFRNKIERENFIAEKLIYKGE